MLERFYSYAWVLQRARGGALGAILDDVAAHLHERGHTSRVGQSYLCIAAHFSHWLGLEEIAPTTVSEETLARFESEHLPKCRCEVARGERCHVRAALGHVLAVLRARGWAAARPLPLPSAVDRVLAEFEVYLLDTRGVAPATCENNTRCARRFLEARYGAGDVDLRQLGAKELIDFILEQSRACVPGTAALMRGALRNFLRFAHLQGLCDGTLASAVPKVAHWRRANLPRSLSDEQLARLLGAFDRSTATGKRDHAMVSCLASMALRAGEVAALLLEDLDWRAGTLRIGRGKERRASFLPLPARVGRAIVAYLRHGRPPTADRHVFVRHQLPVGQQLTSGAVTAAVGLAFMRAQLDVACKGAHVLRHTAAARMVRGGASLKEVADVLRHRSLETTMIYTKVDLPALADLALPWPEVRS